ncbi:MAG: hypothetical protein WC750_02830 [Patescibacteria group bacterium]
MKFQFTHLALDVMLTCNPDVLEESQENRDAWERIRPVIEETLGFLLCQVRPRQPDINSPGDPPREADTRCLVMAKSMTVTERTGECKQCGWLVTEPFVACRCGFDHPVTVIVDIAVTASGYSNEFQMELKVNRSHAYSLKLTL